jgi:hypothetical protein
MDGAQSGDAARTHGCAAGTFESCAWEMRDDDAADGEEMSARDTIWRGIGGLGRGPHPAA